VFGAESTGAWWLDGAASIVISAILGATAIWLAVETKGLLIGEAARPSVVRGIREKVGAHGCVAGINEVLTMHVGPEFVLATVSVTFAPEASAAEVQRAVADIDREIRATWPIVRRVYIEGEAPHAAQAHGPETA